MTEHDTEIEPMQTDTLPTPRRRWLILAVLTLWTVMFAVGQTTEPRFEDELWHLQMVRLWTDQWPQRPRWVYSGEFVLSGWFSAPGWAATMTTVCKLAGGFHWRLIQAAHSLLWTLTVVLAWRLGRAVFPRRPAVAWVTALLYLSVPIVALTGVVMFIEPMGALFTLGSLVLLARRKHLWAAAVGAMMWYGKLSAGAFIPALLAGIFVSLLLDRRPLLRRAVVMALAVLITAAVTGPDICWRHRVGRDIPQTSRFFTLRADLLLQVSAARTPEANELVRDVLVPQPPGATTRPHRSRTPLPRSPVFEHSTPSTFFQPVNWVRFPGLAIWLGLAAGLWQLIALWRTALRDRRLWVLATVAAVLTIGVAWRAPGFRYIYPVYGLWALAGASALTRMRVRALAWAILALSAVQTVGTLAMLEGAPGLGAYNRRLPKGTDALMKSLEPGEFMWSPDSRVFQFWAPPNCRVSEWSRGWGLDTPFNVSELLDPQRQRPMLGELYRRNIRRLCTSRMRVQKGTGTYLGGFTQRWLDRGVEDGLLRRVLPEAEGWLVYDILPPSDAPPTTAAESRPEALTSSP